MKTKNGSLTLDTYAVERDERRGRKTILEETARFVDGRRDELSFSWGMSTLIVDIYDTTGNMALVRVLDGRTAGAGDPDDIEAVESHKVKAWLERIGLHAHDDGEDVYVNTTCIQQLVTALLNTTEKEVMESLW